MLLVVALEVQILGEFACTFVAGESTSQKLGNEGAQFENSCTEKNDIIIPKHVLQWKVRKFCQSCVHTPRAMTSAFSRDVLHPHISFIWNLVLRCVESSLIK